MSAPDPAMTCEVADMVPTDSPGALEIGFSIPQGYNASDNNRWKYGMTERDATSGLDHTWFRKYESLSGRWTSRSSRGVSPTEPGAPDGCQPGDNSIFLGRFRNQ